MENSGRNPSDSWIRKNAEVLLLTAMIVVSLSYIFWQAHVSHEVPYLSSKKPAKWITYPTVASRHAQGRVEMATRFERTFRLDSLPADASIAIRALRRFELYVNRHRVLGSTGDSWKRPSFVPISSYLKTGENSISVNVINDAGPPVLWLQLSGTGIEVYSDESWGSSLLGGSFRNARSAKNQLTDEWFDPSVPSIRWRQKTPWEALVDHWQVFLVFILVGAGVALIAEYGGLIGRGRRPLPILLTPARRDIVLLMIPVCAWAVLFANNFPLLNPETGFDAKGHIDYIRYLVENHRLPLAEDGWQTYHPPLFYILGALLVWGLNAASSIDQMAAALRYMTMGVGILHFIVILLCLRLLFPQQIGRQAAGLLFAAFLPMQLYMHHYVTNETMAALLVTMAMYICLKEVSSTRISIFGLLLLGFVFGLAMLSKSSALITLPVIIGALALRSFQTEGFVNAAKNTFLALFVIVAVCGWHYVRVYMRYDRFLVGNWEVNSVAPWWQFPGYSMAATYLNFGNALIQPLLSGTHSFWDSLYSTLWGDGYVGGMSGILDGAPPWNSDLHVAGYLLAVFPTAAILLGVIVSLKRFVKKPTLQLFLMLSQPFLTLVALIHMTLKIPHYSAAKSFYGMSAILSLTFFFTVGVSVCLGRWRWTRILSWTLLVLWALSAYGAFWIQADAPHTHLAYGHYFARKGDEARAEKKYRAALAVDPSNVEALHNVAIIQTLRGQLAGAKSNLSRALELAPDNARLHLSMARIHIKEDGDSLDRALRATRRAIELNPNLANAHMLHAILLIKSGSPDQGIVALQEVLRIEPQNRLAHQTISVLVNQAK